MKKPGVLLAVLFVCLYILPLGVRPLFIPDETRYAEIAREMNASGDWVVPRLDGLRYFEKPVLGHWLNAWSIRVFGENDFATRLPSALAAGLQAGLVLLLASRFSGASSAWLATLVFLSSAEVFVVGVFNVLDTMFSLFVTAAMVAFFFAYMAPEGRACWMALVAMGIACGLGFLTKGFLVFALAAVVIGPFLAWERQWRKLLAWPWVPFLAAVVVALPWAVLIHRSEPDFWRYFLWVEHFQRFFKPLSEAQHPEPFWFFFPIIVGGVVPWTFWLPAAAIGLKDTRLNTPLLRFAVCWLACAFLFFSLSEGKLGTYVLPCYPPLAVLIVEGILQYQKSSRRRMLAAGCIVAAAVAGVAVIGLPLTQLAGPELVRLYRRPEAWKWAAMMVGLGVWIVGALKALKAKETARKFTWFAAGPCVLLLGVHFLCPDYILEMDAPEIVLRKAQLRVLPDAVVVSDNYAVGAAGWYFKRKDVYILEDKGEHEYGLNYEDSARRSISLAQFHKFVRAVAGKRQIVWLTDESRYERQKPDRKPKAETLAGRFALVEY